MTDPDHDHVPEDASEWMRQMGLQLERTERASIVQHQLFQKKTLLNIVEHAFDNVPAYKNQLRPLLRFDGGLDVDGWHDLPVLDRKQAVALGSELVARQIPDGHGPIGTGQTSGSTTEIFRFKVSQFHRTMWSCITARYHRWHGIDYSKNLASIRPYGVDTAAWPGGCTDNGWGPIPFRPKLPGSYFTLNINTPIDQQIAWLQQTKPDYLHSFPSNLRAIALGILENDNSPLELERVLSFGEMLNDDTREIISEAFGQNPIDCYSTRECGYLALQSPVGSEYLVQSEASLVEILDDENLPCEPGETGRVVVTALHNYAQPLIRYAIGDYATVGDVDKSGLPFRVLSKIFGRSRNMFRFPGGKLVQPDFKTKTFAKYLKPVQWQVAQTGPLALEVRIVPGVEPSQMDTDGMSAYIHKLLGNNLTITYKLVSEITNRGTGKHEDYICELITGNS